MAPSLFQLPFLRLCVAGRAAVAVFFVITGFVNALNPLKNCYAGNTELVLSNLARSSFSRAARLVFPTSIAIFVAWTFCQFGTFSLATRVDSAWLQMVAHNPDQTVWAALKGLCRCLILFWSNGENKYDSVHWTLAFFLKGSLRIYMALLITALVKKHWRWWTVVFLYTFSWCTNDCKFACLCRSVISW
jgi:hypothetical protein